MLRQIKQLIGILLVVFCFTSLVLAILSIWDVIDTAMAKEAFMNTAYTFGASLLASLVIYLVMNMMSDKK